jgi:hypothetical protein
MNLDGVHSAGGVSKSNAKVFIISPENNSTVTNPVKIVFGASGMKIVPAGVNENFSGHHHLLIDVKELPDLSKPIPSDKNYLHFGKGQKSAEIQLEKGVHTLQLLLGDHMHIPHADPIYSEKIIITVK